MEVPDNILPDGWYNDRVGRLRCPHDAICDPDGHASCQQNCKSPLLEKGLI